MMHRMSYAIMCPWPTGPRHRAVYTRIYIHLVVDDVRMAILCNNSRSYDIAWVVTPLQQYAVGNLDDDE